ncbi:hypothetical protein Purlil1_14116 [Purpureocillium lilacinum]|uniref:Uncharacterized protein n=1 Tax=Purpureocillium lilacinum TaxID=33203 RepID=A0ABR0BC66_PURLI|nr:hypothetical protein Purlil1_14116 [Purpureocillium lilacinum]
MRLPVAWIQSHSQERAIADACIGLLMLYAIGARRVSRLIGCRDSALRPARNPAQSAGLARTPFYQAAPRIASRAHLSLPNGERPANLLAAVVEILRQYLTEVQDTSKAPSGFDTALENLSGDGITRSFLEAGFQTWFAFFLAADRNPKLQHSVEQLPLSTIRHIAKEASKIKAHPSMTARIQHILFGSNRGPKRCKVLEAPRSEPRLLKRPRIEGMQQRHVPSSSSFAGPQDMCINDAAEIVQVEEHPGFVSGDDHIVPSTSHMETSATIDFDINPQYHYARPKAKNLPFVFPP